jgi:hypothetical protein
MSVLPASESALEFLATCAARLQTSWVVTAGAGAGLGERLSLTFERGEIGGEGCAGRLSVAGKFSLTRSLWVFWGLWGACCWLLVAGCLLLVACWRWRLPVGVGLCSLALTRLCWHLRVAHLRAGLLRLPCSWLVAFALLLACCVCLAPGLLRLRCSWPVAFALLLACCVCLAPGL